MYISEVGGREKGKGHTEGEERDNRRVTIVRVTEERRMAES